MTRLAITSDLHYGDTPREAIEEVVRQIVQFRPDLTVLAGDLGESFAHFSDCLGFFRPLYPALAVIPGNHDLWASASWTSRELWETELENVVHAAGLVWLEGRSTLLGSVAVIGTIGWYDYSAADPAIRESPRCFAQEKRYFIPDAKRINWSWSDREFAERVSNPFLAELDRLEANPNVQQVIVITHVPALECQMPRRPGDMTWGFSNAYFGNLTLGQQILQRSKVTQVISGHTHVGRDEQLLLPDGRSLRGQVIGCGLRRPGWIALEL